jgi:cytochrome c-type biogenesis protein CcmH/NrfG
MDKVKNFINNIPKPFKNKYIIILVFFAFWIVFIDDYNLIKQYQLQKNVERLENQKEYYLSEIEKDSAEFYHLQNTKEEQERFAREKFLMKKDNEDIFIIRAKKDD